MLKKSRPNLYRKLLYKLGQDFLDTNIQEEDEEPRPGPSGLQVQRPDTDLDAETQV